MKPIALLLAAALALVASGPLAHAAPTPGDPDVIFSDTYKDPGDNHNWREGMVTGNGLDGVVASGSPYRETLIYQNNIFSMPSGARRETPDVLARELIPTRENVFINNDKWKFNGRRRDFSYAFHPAHQLRLTLSESQATDYRRWTNLATAEVGVAYTDQGGQWERRTFASRADGVVITGLHRSSRGTPIDLALSIDNLASLHKFGSGDERNLQYKKIVAPDASYIALVAHYPSYRGSELKDAGYAGLTRVIVVGGRTEVIDLPGTGEKERQNVGDHANPAIKISGATAVYLITKSDRDTAMGPVDRFAPAATYPLLDRLAKTTADVAARYDRGRDGFNYSSALAAHVKLHGEQYARVKLDLRAPAAQRALTNESLHALQKKDGALNPAYLERAYLMGRYVELCCAGVTTPRLGGMWTGEWNPGWRGIYTMDANVNLQVSPMNTGDLEAAATGYIQFILRQVDDWLDNAAKVYGMHDAIQVPVNTDGERATMLESDADYPFQYWNAGASWMLLPIYEYWQCRGNQRIAISDRVDIVKLRKALGVADGGLTEAQAKALADRGWLDLERDILLPLLTKQANFWEQLCTPEYYTDAQGIRQRQAGKTSLNPGEKYLLIPTYSPENKPQGYNSTLTVNAAMDIAAARDGLDMTIALEKAVARPESAAAIARWTKLRAALPDYQYDGKPGELTPNGGGGALREWATLDYIENNNHRHSSHLYLAWPGYETRRDPALHAAALAAVANRDRLNRNDNTTGHGWAHRALISARLGDGADVTKCLHSLIASDIYYTSMVTDHNTNRSARTYCTDTSIGLVGTLNEALVFSDTGVIELLPALPVGLPAGSIDGLLARTRARIERLEWAPGTVTTRIRSDIAQTLRLRCAQTWRTAEVDGGRPAKITPGQEVVIALKAGQTITIRFR